MKQLQSSGFKTCAEAFAYMTGVNVGIILGTGKASLLEATVALLLKAHVEVHGPDRELQPKWLDAAHALVSAVWLDGFAELIGIDTMYAAMVGSERDVLAAGARSSLLAYPDAPPCEATAGGLRQ